MSTAGTSGLLSGVAYILGDWDFSTYPAARIEQFVVRAKDFVNNDMGWGTGDGTYITGLIGTDFNVTGAISGMLELKAAAMIARASLATYARTTVNVREADSSINTGPRAVNFRDFVDILEQDYQKARKEYQMGLPFHAVYDRSHSSYRPLTGDLEG